MANRDVRFVLTAVDRTTATLNRVSARLNHITAPVRNLSKAFSGVSKAAHLDLLASGLRSVTSVVRNLGFVAAGALGSVGVFMRRFIKQGDELGDTAAKIGLSASALQELRFAAEESGASVAEFDTGFRLFLKNIAADSKRTGKTPLELFDVLAEKIMAVENPAERVWKATQLLGRGGASLVPLLARGKDGIAALRHEFVRLGGGISDAGVKEASKADDALRRLFVSVRSVGSAFGTALTPRITAAADAMTAWITQNQELTGKNVTDFANKLGDAIERLPGIAQDIVTSLTPISAFFDRMERFIDKIEGAKRAVNRGTLRMQDAVDSTEKPLRKLRKAVGLDEERPRAFAVSREERESYQRMLRGEISILVGIDRRGFPAIRKNYVETDEALGVSLALPSWQGPTLEW